MGCNPIDRLVLAGLLLTGTVIGASSQPDRLFEESPALNGSWRSRGIDGAMSVSEAGFAVGPHRFRWTGFSLTELRPEDSVESHSILLTPYRVLRRATRLRAENQAHTVSILYYVGDRGPEFDIEIEPMTNLPALRLSADDGEFSIDTSGALKFNGAVFLLKPVATGARVHYRLNGPRTVIFDIASQNRHRRIVIDPVVTFATYLGGSSGDGATFIHELPDGSIVMVGVAGSTDAPQAVELTGIAMEPPAGGTLRNCFIEKLAPGASKIVFLDYFGGPASVECQSADVDQNGRVLIAGTLFAGGNITTPNAQYPSPPIMPPNSYPDFLARISADGQQLDYSTYLYLTQNAPTPSLAAGPGDEVYLAFTCGNNCQQLPPVAGVAQATGDIAVIGYNIAQASPNLMTLYGGSQDGVVGVTIAPSGDVFIFGSTSSTNLPLLNPLQNQLPPVFNATGGFVASFSANLQSLHFSTYLGGQNGMMSLASLIFTSTGTIRASGGAYEGAIPGTQAVESAPLWYSPFSVEFAPGDAGFRSAFLAGGGYFSGPGLASSAFPLASGVNCLVINGDWATIPPASIPFTTTTYPTQVLGPFLACLNAQNNGFQIITETNSSTVAPSQKGGVWAQGNGTIPADLLPGSLQPSGDMVLRYIDLGTPKPVLGTPAPLSIVAVSPYEPSNLYYSVSLSGKNFALGMYLSLGNISLPLSITDSENATLLVSTASNLEAGNYMGQFVIPTQPQAVASDPFPVVVTNQMPAAQPFGPGTSAGAFSVGPPVYPTSQVTWQGQAVPVSQTSSGLAVQIPLALLQPGVATLALTNPPPGGGVQTQSFQISNSGTATPLGPLPSGNSFPAAFFTVDKQREILYTISQQFASNDTLTAYQLPSGTQIAMTTIPEGTSSQVLDLEISANGAYLYVADDQLRITRYETNGFTQDFQIQIANDAIPLPDGKPAAGFAVRPFTDTPDAFVVATPGGQLVVYDGAQPRPYTTTDFPSLDIPVFDTVLASSSYLYAVERPNVLRGSNPLVVPCVARFPMDAFGLGAPQDFCNLGFEWGTYPEMQTYSGTLGLADASGAYAVNTSPDVTGEILLSAGFDFADNVMATPYGLTFNLTTRATTERILFSNLTTGAWIGDYPAQSVLIGAVGKIIFLSDGTLIFSMTSSASSNVTIVPNWLSAMQSYR
jgi:hypothetical protein